MNKELFEMIGYKVKVRDVIITVIIIIIILLLSLRGCSSNDIKDDAINNPCEVTRRNLSDLNDLLSRTDLCSEDWFNDLDDYLDRLNEQNELLKDKKDQDNKNIYQLQVELVKDLENFKDKQSKENVQELEDTLKEYRDNYDLIDKCKGEV